jgi:hypothetical protein
MSVVLSLKIQKWEDDTAADWTQGLYIAADASYMNVRLTCFEVWAYSNVDFV